MGLNIESNSPDNVLEHAVIEYAGSGRWTGSNDSEAALRVVGMVGLSDVLIRESGGNGLFLTNDATLVTCTNVTFENIAKQNIVGDDDLVCAP